MLTAKRMKKAAKFMIAGGGTGGHVYPALAIADELKERFPEAEFLFVGAKGRMEMEKVPKAGYPIRGLWISGIQRRLTVQNLLFPLKLLVSYLKAWGLVRSFKPDLVVGVGGYASGPVVHIASLMKVPTLIQEQNSYAGITNRLLGRTVDRVCVAFEGMERYFPKEKIRITGNPIRKDLSGDKLDRGKALKHFGLSGKNPVLLVLGGSLGAKAINESVLEHADRFLEEGLDILWQTGARYEKEVEEQLEGRDPERVRTSPFIERMDLAYAAADIVVARAGAITVSELASVGKASIFIPSPNVAEDHQTKNAQSLVDRGAAILVPDHRAKSELPDAVIGLLHDPEARKELEVNMKKGALSEPAKAIGDELVDLLKGGKG